MRWAESVNLLDEKLSGLVGDTLIAAASVAYIGPFTATYRKELVSSWIQLCGQYAIPISQKFDLVKSTVDAYQVRRLDKAEREREFEREFHVLCANMILYLQVLKWQNKGLPQDNHSTENALIVKRTKRWPLFIDPQGQAVK